MTESTERNNLPITFLGDFSRKLLVNTFFNFLGRFCSFAATILLTPFIWSHLTRGEFGVWVLLSVFLESLALFDLGLGSAFVKFISAFYTHEDYGRINKVLFSGLVFYLLQGVLLVGAGLAARGLLFDFFDIHGAETAYLYALLACAIGNIGAMFLSVFRGVQRMDKSNAIEMGMSILNVVGTIFVLQSGWGLTGLAMNALVNAMVLVVVSWFSVTRAMPWISLRFQFDGSFCAKCLVTGRRFSSAGSGELSASGSTS